MTQCSRQIDSLTGFSTKRTRRRRCTSRPLGIEPLEQRRLLSAAPVVNATAAFRTYRERSAARAVVSQAASIALATPTAIVSKWVALGGAAGALGNPVAAETKSPAPDWTFRRFERGTVYSHPRIGTFSSTESIANWNSRTREVGKAGLHKLDAKDMLTDDSGKDVGRYASSDKGTLFFRRDVGVIEVAPKAALALPQAAAPFFSANYRALRQRYLDYFWYNGLSAKEILVVSSDATVSFPTIRKVEITDQGVHMGQAMLTFAGEAKLLRSKGVSSAASETVIRGLLDGFDRLDAADKDLYGTDARGFFVRDDARQTDVPWTLKSDFIDPKASNAAMSIDQTTSLMVGWWAIAKYSSNAQSVARAKEQMRRVMDFLDRSGWIIQMPNGQAIDPNRGADFRYAAGFYCTLADNVLGSSFLRKSGVDVTIKGTPVRFNVPHLGEFTIPGLKLPAKLPVALSHAAVLAISPLAAIGLSAGPTIPIRIGDLFKDLPQTDINLPCAHLEPEHPDGHTNTVPCVHVTVAHKEGHEIPCVHPTALHPAGDSVWLPCAHIGPIHDWHRGIFGQKIRCWHIGPMHAGGHRNTVPCVHITTQHKSDTIPCVHPAQVHPDGDKVTLPCLHLKPAHEGGHTFDPRQSSIDIPLGNIDKKVKPYARHIVLQNFAFDAKVPVLQMKPAALQSNHVWSLLLRGRIVGDVPLQVVANLARQSLGTLKAGTAPSNLLKNEWCRANRWELSTATDTPDKDGPYAYNGIDYLGLEVLSRLSGITP